jgi:LuxR family maltose regulon positive regulatory protein
MAKGGEADLQEAHILIGKQIEHGNAVHNVNFLIPALALRALLFWKQANDKGAFESLHASLGLAAPGQYIRPFVDMGSQMLELLRDYKKSLEANDYVDTIIKALENEKSAVSTISETSTLKSSPTSFAINNELSIRELEVLKEVSQGFRNQEIAERLFVSEGTIKKHMYRMFQKWDVKNRIGLIKKGKELSLLKED